MRNICSSFIGIALVAVAAWGASPESGTTKRSGVHGRNWRGTLVNANCEAAAGLPRHELGPTVILMKWAVSPAKSCPATQSSGRFALMFADGRLVKLDEAGSRAIAGAWKKNARWSSGEPPRVRLEGTLAGDVLHVDSVR